MKPSLETSSQRPDLCLWCHSQGPTPSQRFKSEDWKIWACAKCGTEFVWPMPSRAELAPYYEYSRYAAPSYDRNEGRRPEVGSEFSQLLRRVERCGVKRGRLLDVGCSVGNYLRVVSGLGWEATGIELDSETAERAARSTGLKVLSGDGLDVLEPGERFDLILMSHWLEHIVNPRHQLELAIRHIASPQGGILIRVPNAASTAAKVLGGAWSWFYPPVHLSYFNARSFSTLARQMGQSVPLLFSRRGDAQSLPVELLMGGTRSLVRVVTGRDPLSGKPSGDPLFGRLHEHHERRFNLIETLDSMVPASRFFAAREDSELVVLLMSEGERTSRG